jgi:hypothetical protein
VVIVPAEAVQVTPAFAESFITVAVKVCVAPAIIDVGLAGLIATLISEVVVPPPPPLLPLPPPQPATIARVRKLENVRTTRRKFDMSFTRFPVSTEAPESKGRQQWTPSDSRVMGSGRTIT